MTVELVAILAGLAVFVAVYAIAAPVNDIFEEDPEEVLVADAVNGKPSTFERLVRPAVRNVLPQTPMSALIAARKSTKIKELLIRSGNPWNVTPEEFLGMRIVSGVTGLFIFLFLAIIEFLPTMLPIAGWAALGLALGYYFPKVRIDRHVGARRKGTQRGLPEALDLLVIILNAGMQFQPALAEVVSRLPEGVMRDELARVLSDLKANKTIETALTDLARRAPGDEVEAFCKAIVQGQRLGADMSETLKAQAASARQAYEAALDERIGKLPTTLFFPILGLMLPALFLVIMAPAFSEIGKAL